MIYRDINTVKKARGLLWKKREFNNGKKELVYYRGKSVNLIPWKKHEFNTVEKAQV